MPTSHRRCRNWFYLLLRFPLPHAAQKGNQVLQPEISLASPLPRQRFGTIFILSYRHLTLMRLLASTVAWAVVQTTLWWVPKFIAHLCCIQAGVKQVQIEGLPAITAGICIACSQTSVRIDGGGRSTTLDIALSKLWLLLWVPQISAPPCGGWAIASLFGRFLARLAPFLQIYSGKKLLRICDPWAIHPICM